MRRQKTRTPLFGAVMQNLLRRRGHELIGIFFLTVGLIFLFVILDDRLSKTILNANNTAVFVQGSFRYYGAILGSILLVVLGYASLALVFFLVVIGLRYLTHYGAERIFERMFTFPLFIIVGAVFCASLIPEDSWGYNFGLGGLLGDTLLGLIAQFMPFAPSAMVNFLAPVLLAGMIFLGFYATGFTYGETNAFLRFSWHGIILFYAMILWSVQRVGRPLFIPLEDEGYGQAPEGEPKKSRKEPDFPAESKTLESIDETRIRKKIAEAIKLSQKPYETMVNDEPNLGAGGFSASASASLSPDVVFESELLSKEIEPEKNPKENFVPLLKFEEEEQQPSDLEQGPKIIRPSTQKTSMQSRQARREAQPLLKLSEDSSAVGNDYIAPPLSLLTNPMSLERHQLGNEALEENARMLECVLDDYGVKGEIVSVLPGPVVTLYELEPVPGLKASRVIGLADDIARSMSALSARVSTVPGRSVIGIELPNSQREKVILREILSHKDFGDTNHSLPLALGKTIEGRPLVVNLAKMPHLLIAGTTGSGKSVAINTMILSLLYRLTPSQCRMIMIDPKMLELSVYDGIPHLLSPVVTDPKKAVLALKWVVGEMEERYRKMSKMGVRNIAGYNMRVQECLDKGELFSRTVQTGFDDETGEPVFETEEFKPEPFPYIVVVVDEMADLMMVAGKEIEACIQRLAQMARASGIHLIMATQRPSVDVITGTIKANFPTRISFQVTTKIDSRTILGEIGAEQLLGMGDMLYMANGGRITRVHGPFCSDEEVEEVVKHLKRFGPPDYSKGITDTESTEAGAAIDEILGLGGNTSGADALYDQAVAIVLADRRCSTSYIQRKLSVGYNKAARLVEQMEESGLVSAANHVGKREILVPEQ